MTHPRQQQITAIRASGDDIAPILHVMVRAFHNDPISKWLVPDESIRPRILRDFFDIMVAQAFNYGYVDVHPDRIASAVWIPPTPPIAHYEQRLRDATGTYHDRFRKLDEAFDGRHPTTVPHQYLAFLSVSPSHQRQHHGGALLDHRLATLDGQGVPAYLVASTARSVKLYMQKGFTYHGLPLALPDGGPTVYPMWRDVQHSMG
jgi:GNAT superfamily N-acetyltransferase